MYCIINVILEINLYWHTLGSVAATIQLRLCSVLCLMWYFDVSVRERERERERDDSGNFYSNIYTGQQPPASWQCHLCTFRNHPLLNKCEQCEMPRIVGTSTPKPQDPKLGSRGSSSRSLGSQADRKELTNTDQIRFGDWHSALPT